MVAMVTHYYEYVSCVFALVTPQRLLVRARVCVCVCIQTIPPSCR